MTKFSDHFDRTVVLSLPECGGRRARLMHNLRECGLAEHRDIFWQDAVDGRREPRPAWWTQGPGAWGCRASHLAVLRAARRDQLESVLIIEDDACFHPRAAEWLAMLVPLLPADWDLFFLGGQHMSDPRPAHDPRLLRGTCITRTHAYVVHQRTYDRLIAAIADLSEYEAHPTWHIDHQLGLGMGLGRWKAVAPAWWLAGQEEGQSHIARNSFSRRWWPVGKGFWRLPFIAASPAESRGAEWLHESPPPAENRDLSRMERALHLRRTAWEAWQQGRLPACDFHPDEIRALWPGGLRTATSAAEIAHLADYPANGLFPHAFSLQ